MLKYIYAFVVVCTLITSSVMGPWAKVHAETVEEKVFISEVKVRNDPSGESYLYDEFIELFNPGSSPALLSDYTLEYFNTIDQPTTLQDPNIIPDPLTTPVVPYKSAVLTTGLLDGGSYYVFAKVIDQIPDSALSPFSSLLDGGGRLRLVYKDVEVVDEIVWTGSSGSTNQPAIYIPSSSATMSISHEFNENGIPQVDGVWQIDVPTPQSSILISVPPEDDPNEVPEDQEDTEISPGLNLTCEGIIINELLPNPIGADAGNEFIELYNPTVEVIPMDGCELKTTANSNVFALDGIILQPGSYLALYDNQTNLTLPNSSGGTVWLLSPTEELQATTYDGGTPDDVSWALINDSWEATYKPTPNTENISLPFKPCSEGQVRNPDTNRCQNIAPVVILSPCPVGQERNPDTNRCRSTVGVVTGLVTCGEGQVRNPDTNRCRNIVSAENSLVPCGDGQERNPETNRCRKIASTTPKTFTEVKDVNTGLPTESPRWWLMSFMVVGAVSYGVYEWRHDLVAVIDRIKNSR